MSHSVEDRSEQARRRRRSILVDLSAVGKVGSEYWWRDMNIFIGTNSLFLQSVGPNRFALITLRLRTSLLRVPFGSSVCRSVGRSVGGGYPSTSKFERLIFVNPSSPSGVTYFSLERSSRANHLRSPSIFPSSHVAQPRLADACPRHRCTPWLTRPFAPASI